MNKGLWIARKNYLLMLVKKVSDGFGGDDLTVFQTHCVQLLEAHKDERIEEAIACYTKMVEQLKFFK